MSKYGENIYFDDKTYGFTTFRKDKDEKVLIILVADILAATGCSKSP